MPETGDVSKHVLADQLEAFIGRSGHEKVAKDAVNPAMIRHWCVVLEDHNPAYLDDASARAAGQGGIVAPSAMMQAWTMPDYGDESAPDAINELYALLDAQGYSAIVATNSEQDYFVPIRVGDTLRSVKTIEAISGEKKTGLGQGFFITSIIRFTNQDGVEVGRQLHRVLKFKPPVKEAAEPVVPRPQPNLTQDIAFFFDMARQHKLAIQGCDACNHLQHPPTTACYMCGSLDLSPREMSGRGTLFTYTIVHAPVVAPFKPPYPVILVELEEGPRVVSELHGTGLADIRIGMPLEVDFLHCPDDLVLPIFRERKPHD
ncbi:Uncharacterized OB-fold protein, contains Zn-ribbon domain [Sphingobium faniae]|nr:Uncharacterized OB-fold protein, contains Zn-ribbon domain [Sphingobium faniae]